MILPCVDRSKLLLEGISNYTEMDSSQQQALFHYCQQQAALRNYFMMQAWNSQSPSPPVFPATPAYLPLINPSVTSAPLIQNPQFLAAFLQQQEQQQQRLPIFFQSSLSSGCQNVSSKCGMTTEELTRFAVSSQLAHLQLFALQQDNPEDVKAAEELNLLCGLQSARKVSEGTITPSPKWKTEYCTTKSEASIPVVTLDDTPSSSSVSCSPASVQAERSASAKDKADDDEEMIFVDVESLDDKNAAKSQRKAHIEFYRKLKALRQREKILECQLCHDKIENREHNVRMHVHSHSDTALYRCKMCGAESKEQSAMFAHMKRCHPTKANVGFEDRRDMNCLSSILLNCFPRSTTKTRVGYHEIIDRIWKNVEATSLAEVKCEICSNSIQVQKNSILRHAHSHPQYRCKKCKLVWEDVTQINCHCKNVHETADPKLHKDYNACTAADVTASVLKKMFPDFC